MKIDAHNLATAEGRLIRGLPSENEFVPPPERELEPVAHHPSLW